MAKKGKHAKQTHYEFKYREMFKALVKGKSVDVEKAVQSKKDERPGTFLGFNLKNINQLWNWKSLEDIS